MSHTQSGPPEPLLLRLVAAGDLFGLMLAGTRGTPRLTAEEERAIGQDLRRQRRAEARLARGRDLPRELRRALRRARAAGRAAREQLVLAHLGLIYPKLKRYAGLLEREDLVNEGVIGLLEAADRWDGRRPFATYATYRIWYRMGRAVQNQGRVVRLAVSEQRLTFRARVAARQLQVDLGDPAGLAEVAAALGRPAAKLAAVLERQQPALSLDAPVLGEGRPLGETIAGPESVEDAALGAASIARFIASLPEEEMRNEARQLAGLLPNGARTARRQQLRIRLRRYLLAPARAACLAHLAGSVELAIALQESLGGKGRNN